MNSSAVPSSVAAEAGPHAGGADRVEELVRAAVALARLLGNPAFLSADEARDAAEVLQTICPTEFSLRRPAVEAFAHAWNEESTLFLGPVVTISLEESVYKPWTDDPTHPLSGARGLAQGDPARHMERILKDFGLALPAESLQSPDHVSVLLEFLAFLLETRSIEEAAAFCDDHLDWMPALTAALTYDGRLAAALKLVRTVESLIETITGRMESGTGLHDVRKIRI